MQKYLTASAHLALHAAVLFGFLSSAHAEVVEPVLSWTVFVRPRPDPRVRGVDESNSRRLVERGVGRFAIDAM